MSDWVLVLAPYVEEYRDLLIIVEGALIALACSLHYYNKAAHDLRVVAEDLKQEAGRLRKATDLALYYLDNPDANKKLLRDGAGDPVGVAVSATGMAAGAGSFRPHYRG